MTHIKQKQVIKNESLAEFTQGIKILYFWSPQCQHCKTTQTPILEKTCINNAIKLDIEKININDNSSKVTSWGVRTVPTIYILDRFRNIAYINNGLTSEIKLMKQLRSINMSD